MRKGYKAWAWPGFLAFDFSEGNTTNPPQSLGKESKDKFVAGCWRLQSEASMPSLRIDVFVRECDLLGGREAARCGRWPLNWCLCQCTADTANERIGFRRHRGLAEYPNAHEQAQRSYIERRRFERGCLLLLTTIPAFFSFPQYSVRDWSLN